MRKLMYCAIGFAMAIFLVASPENSVLLALFSVGSFAIIARRFSLGKKAWLFLFSGALVGFCYILLFTALFFTPLEGYYDETLEVQGTVLEFPQWQTYQYSVLVSLELQGKGVKTLLNMDKSAENLQPGDQFSTLATLHNAQESYYGEFSTYYTSKGILLWGSTEGALEISEVGADVWKYFPSYLAQNLKNGIWKVFPERYAGTVQALVTGNRDDLTEHFSSSLERAGLSHTVAISGMHLAFLAGMMRLFLPSGRKWTAGVIIFIMFLFMLVSGSTPSIMRATVMIVLLHLAPLFGRERDDGTALALALALILLQNPFAANHMGLHLSVLSVAGILCLSDKIQEKLSSYFHYDWEFATMSPQKFILSSISATMSAMIFTTPLVAIYFGSVSLIAPLSNLLTLWAISFAFAMGLSCGILSLFFPILATFLSFPLLPILEYLLRMIPILATNPLASIHMDNFYYRIFLFFVYVLLFLAWYLPGKKSVFPPLLASVFAFGLAFSVHHFSYFRTDFSFEVFDVGQGQSILFTIEDTLVLSDCGGNSSQNVGDMVADRIQSLGRNKLDLLVVSHFHDDHANGVVQLLDRIDVEVIAMPQPKDEDRLQQEVLEKMREKGTELWVISQETVVPVTENAHLRLFPPLGAGDSNEEGLTLLVTVGEVDVLLTGDMGSDIEEVLVSTYELPDVEVFVVGHHGSKFSTSEVFLDTIQAEIAIISVSGRNSYGHPTPEVLWKLYDRDIQVFRTDLHGSMWFQATG